MTEIDPKLSRVYREASREGPPAAVDAAILAAARKRVGKSQRSERPLRQGRWSRWMVPAGAIATLVLGVSIALLVEREQAGTSGDTAIRQLSPRLKSPPPAPATEPAKASDSAAPAAKKEALAPAARSPVPAQPAQAPVSATIAPVPAPVPVPAVPPQVPAPATPPQVSDFLMHKVAPTPPAPAPALAPTPMPAAPASSAAEAFPAERRAKASAPKAVEPGAAAPNAAAQDTGTVSNAAGDLATGRLDAPAAPAAPAAAAKPAPMRQQAIQRSPQAWLDEINRLKREGREKEAAEQLAEFRKAYPAHAVPEELLK